MQNGLDAAIEATEDSNQQRASRQHCRERSDCRLSSQVATKPPSTGARRAVIPDTVPITTLPRRISFSVGKVVPGIYSPRATRFAEANRPMAQLALYWFRPTETPTSRASPEISPRRL